MENLNAEQVKRGLERCANEWHCGLCGFTEKECALIKKSALALITSQEQRIKELTEENERLREHIKEGIDLAKQIPEMLNEVSRSTVRKMQERLHARFKSDANLVYSNYNIHRYIDQIAKELEGE